jgi:cellulose synthase/poly-beta-1,6-N-acetylglucosamine synthase-like glycosyltransferase
VLDPPLATRDALHSMREPSVSVVLPAYNAERWIARAMESIRSQILEEWELIVVDDGSTDGTPGVVESIAARDARIRLIRQDHAGVAVAANVGMAEAAAPFIARMDADDESRPERLARQVQSLENNPGWDVVSCRVHFAGDRQVAGGYAHYVDWANGCVSPEAIRLNRFIDLPAPNPTLMYRRAAWEKLGEFRVNGLPEDYECFLRGIEAGLVYGKVAGNTAQPLYDWHDPPSRLSRNDANYSPEAFWKCKAPFLSRAIADTKPGCDLWIWGAGRPTRLRAAILEREIGPAVGFIDVDPDKIGNRIEGRPVVGPGGLPRRGQSIILACVGSRDARDKIRGHLMKMGWVEGGDFWIVA